MEFNRPALLPFALHVAAKTVAIDNIKVNPTNEKQKDHLIWTFKFGDWENRLINLSVKKLTSDINEHLNNNKDSIFYPYQLGGKYSSFLFFVSTKLNYKIE